MMEFIFASTTNFIENDGKQLKKIIKKTTGLRKLVE